MAAKRILVVDDSCMYQRLLSDAINAHENLEVVGVASNGRQALEIIPSLTPDLVTLDILMPELDGIQALIEITKRWPATRTIMVSSLTTHGSDAALDAMALGANEYSAKPTSSGGVKAIREVLNGDLIPKIEALCGIEKTPVSEVQRVASKSRQIQTRSSTSISRQVPDSATQIVAIGVSTGGPDALGKVLAQLPGDLEVPIVIVQHMPAEFTAKLAERLNATCDLTIKEADEGDRLESGTVYIAPGNYHMVVVEDGSGYVINLNQDAPENSCRPAVDPLFRSVAEVFGSKCLGVILTGMGQDGLRGSEALFSKGASILVQDEATCVVWGMPKLVAMAGLAEDQVPLNHLALRILERVRPVGAIRRVAQPRQGDASNASSYQGVNARVRG